MERLSSALDRMHAFCLDQQRAITRALAEIDGGAFEFTEWKRAGEAPPGGMTAGGGGGGTMATLRGHAVEKAGVNVSLVHGDRNPLTGNPFAATGLSVIVHPANPHAPTVHLNVRYFEETAASGEGSAPRAWYGGGMDLTPMGFPYAKDTEHFHDVCRAAVSSAGFDYAEAARRADAYFFVRHRGRPRGVGGVFYDEVPADGRGERLVRAIGSRFLDAYRPILERRAEQPSTEAERQVQLRARGVYVEFNLLYDKGTRFGFESGGNPDAILVSLPPLVSW